MKSKEVIKLLKEVDPTGETEVSVGNHAIYNIHQEPAYYDGKLQLLIYDSNNQVIGAKYCTKGSKIVISEMSVTDVLWDNPEAIIDYSELHESTVERYRQSDEKTRADSRDVNLRINIEHFYKWCKTKALPIRDNENLRYKSKSFFERNLSVEDAVKTLPQRYDEKNDHWYWPS